MEISKDNENENHTVAAAEKNVKASSAPLPLQEATASALQTTEHTLGPVENPSQNVEDSKPTSTGLFHRIWNTIIWVPPSCRYDPKNPPKLTLALNMLFGFACTFTVANLYYSHPLLNILAISFDVSQERASIIPTVAQAGYAAGLLFLCPLGDIVKRRPFVLLLMAFTATVSLGLCLTKSFEAFVALNFIMSVTTVTPQIMLPLVGQLAAPNRRATAISIVVSGLLLGILIARLLSGIIANYSSWRNVYWMSFALQYLILFLLWLWMPDYPQTNKNLNYFRMLFSILEIIVKYPLLVQSCLIGFFVSSTFTSFWTTLTFLLSDVPYNYSTVIIGLFALAGIVPMLFGPFFAHRVTDKFDTHVSVLMGQSFCLVGIIIGTYTGKLSVAGPIIQAIVFDLGQQISQVANRTAVYSVEPKAANRVNTAYMVCVFCGQLMGTAAGNHLYASGGWILSGSANVGFMGSAMLVLLLRGPKETRWVGWRGGIDLRKKKKDDDDSDTPQRVEVEAQREQRECEKTGADSTSVSEETATAQQDDLEKGNIYEPAEESRQAASS